MSYRMLYRDLQVARQTYIDLVDTFGLTHTRPTDWIVSAFWHIPGRSGRRSVAVDWFCWSWTDQDSYEQVLEAFDVLISLAAGQACVNGEM